ncbi:MAG: ATP-grasp domain-containing protein [Pirellulaceae bacterium]
MSESLLILGASARAAVQSTCLAGLRPLAADMFADDDLRACCPVIHVRDYPRDLVNAAREFAACPWMYTGALENHLEVLSQIAKERPLLGNSASVVREVRDPWKLVGGLQRAGLLCPAILRPHEAAPRGDWLWKPLRSAGGLGIGSGDTYGPDREASARKDLARIESETVGSPSELQPPFATHYRQQKILGDSIGAVFVGARRQARLLGVTRQLVGSHWTGASGFQYAGSMGPLTLDGIRQRDLERLGLCVAARFGLTGLFGVDCIANERGLWTIEVNPRYTASVELLERSLGVPAITWHREACLDASLPGYGHQNFDERWGKAVIYATERVRIGGAFYDLVARTNATGSWPWIADIPAIDSEIDSGHPVTTVFASGRSPDEIEQGLRRRAREVFRSLA